MTTLEKMVADARQLVGRLQEHDTCVDTLISNAQGLFTRISIMKEYEEDVSELGGSKQQTQQSQRSSRSQLVLGIAQESRQMRDLRQENDELRSCLEEHQAALELIMSKYREQMLRLATGGQLERTVADVLGTRNGVEPKVEKICELVTVMRAAAALDDASADRMAQQLAQLELENKGLRDMLFISRKYGSKDLDDFGNTGRGHTDRATTTTNVCSSNCDASKNTPVPSGAAQPATVDEVNRV